MHNILLFLPLFAAPEAQDFNNDGYADLAIGAPDDTVDGVQWAGSVTVLYGSASGLTAAGADYWHQDVPGIQGVAEQNDNFGAALAWGDFNGDDYDDLAIGVPNETVDEYILAGIVHVLYGSANGLSATGDQLLRLDDPGMAGDLGYSAHYGASLAAGNFNGAAGGYDDLVIGMPGATVYGEIDAGRVHVMYGSPGGLSTSGDVVWNQAQASPGQTVEWGDGFGSALAAGHFNADGYADIAIGTPLEDVGSLIDAGLVQVLYGSSQGLQPGSTQLWHQNMPGILDSAEAYGAFGTALAAGDFDGDSYDDLAASAPSEDLDSGVVNAGAVNVIYGSAAGLSSAGNEILIQGSGLQGVAEAGDRTGLAVASGDFDGDGYDDLAVGSPYETVGNVLAGAVQVARGHVGGLWNGSEYNLLPGIGSDVGQNDRFGAALAAGDFDGDGQDDLAVGTPNEDIGATQQAGEVEVFYGPAGSAGHDVWHQATPGGGAAFGAALSN
ncbi:MAG: hypothetical protein EYC70_09350 [Planctomycetota bacterium]|nr:MAG: hypothetical protein EYC70_09350 [Planctomycetota bacterium]